MPKPTASRIMVKPHQDETYVPTQENSLSEYGEIVAVGSAVKRFKIGDKIGFSVFGVEKLIIGEEKYYFLRDDDDFILCTLT